MDNGHKKLFLDLLDNDDGDFTEKEFMYYESSLRIKDKLRIPFRNQDCDTCNFEADFQRVDSSSFLPTNDLSSIYSAFMPCSKNIIPTNSADETRELAESQFVSHAPPSQTSIDSYFVSNRNTFTAAVTVRNDDFLAQEHSIQINIRTKTKKPDTNLRAKEQPKTHRYLTRARQKELDQANSIISNVSTPATLTPQRKNSKSSEKICENSNQGKRQRKPGDSPETRDVKKNAVADITRGMTKMAKKGEIPEFKKICKDLGMKKKDVLKDLKKQFVGCKSYIKLSKILPKMGSEGEPGAGEYTLKNATRDLCDAFFKQPYNEYFMRYYKRGGKVGEDKKKDLTSEEHKQREIKRKEIFLRLKQEFKENFEDPNKKAREGKTEERILKIKDFSK